MPLPVCHTHGVGAHEAPTSQNRPLTRPPEVPISAFLTLLFLAGQVCKQYPAHRHVLFVGAGC